MKNNNIVWHDPLITRNIRNKINGHKSMVIWLTGLPSSGKSTIAHNTEKRLWQQGIKTYTFDGDNIRHGLCSDLGFTKYDRDENLRRVAETIKLFIDAGIVVLAAFVSPLREQRETIKNIIGKQDFVEVYCKCPVEICEIRDPKGMYKKARLGIIKEYTGISSVYEEPLNPDLIIDTYNFSLEKSINELLTLINNKIFFANHTVFADNISMIKNIEFSN